MLLLKAKSREPKREERPEEFFARYILSRAFEGEQEVPGSILLEIGLINPKTAYELTRLKDPETGEKAFMLRTASYPSSGIEDWMRGSIFNARHEAHTYIHYLRSTTAQVQRA
jgi:hypothetical protein